MRGNVEQVGLDVPVKFGDSSSKVLEMYDTEAVGRFIFSSFF